MLGFFGYRDAHRLSAVVPGTVGLSGFASSGSFGISTRSARSLMRTFLIALRPPPRAFARFAFFAMFAPLSKRYVEHHPSTSIGWLEALLGWVARWLAGPLASRGNACLERLEQRELPALLARERGEHVLVDRLARDDAVNDYAGRLVPLTPDAADHLVDQLAVPRSRVERDVTSGALQVQRVTHRLRLTAEDGDLARVPLDDEPLEVR